MMTCQKSGGLHRVQVFYFRSETYFWFFTSCSAGFGCRHGSAGLRSRLPRPIIHLPSCRQSAALLRLVMSNQKLRIALPPSLSLQPALRYVSTGLAQSPGFSGRIRRGRRGLDCTELLKGPRHIL